MLGDSKNYKKGISMRKSLVMLGLSLLAPWAAAQPIELRTAGRDSEPMFMVRGGQASGVCPDIYAALQRVDKDLKIRGAERLLSLPLAERGLADGSLDINCSFGKSPQRDTYLRYVDELIRTSMVIAVRADDPIADIKNMQELVELSKQGNPIIVRRGTAFVERLQKLGAVIDYQSTDNKVNIAKLINRRGRFYYNIDYLMAAQIKEEPGLGKMRILPTAFEPQVNYIAVSKKLPLSVDKRIHAAMAELRKTGELQQILAHYGLNGPETK
jgi:polar amino acid transport system substrate-binding protein